MNNFPVNIINLDKIKLGDHTVLFYTKEAEMINSTAAFIKSSLIKAEKCLYIDSQEIHQKVKKVLKKELNNYQQYVEAQQLLFLTKEDSYGNPAQFNSDKMIKLIIQEVKKAKKEGYQGLSITGELKGVIDFAGGKEEIISYEWKLHDRVFKKYPVSALCRYNINKFDQEVIKAALELHDYIVWEGRLNDNPYYIDPEGYRKNKVEEYEIKSWLNNISKYQKRNMFYKKTINETNKKYNRLYHNAPIGIVKTTAGGEIIQLNQKMAEIAGFNQIKAVYNNYASAFDFYDDFKRREEFLTQIKNDFMIRNFEFKCKDKNKKNLWLMMNSQIIENEETDDFIIESFVFDITEKKKYELQLQENKEELSASNQQLQAYNEEIMAMNEELESSFTELEDLNKRFEQMVSLLDEIDNLNEISEEEFLSEILQKAIEIIPEADYGSIYTFGDQYINFVDCIGYNLTKLKQREIKNEAFYNYNSIIEIVDSSELKSRNIKYMEKNDFYKLEANSLNKIKEIMYLDLEINGLKKAGISLDIAQTSNENFSSNSKRLFKAFYNIISSFYKLKEYNLLQKDFTKEIISSAIKMLEMYDLYTRGHSENVANLAVEIAKEMNLKDSKIDSVYWAGMVHDIGKMLIPLEILNKEGKLTDYEYDVIKEHPVLGSNVLKSSHSLKKIAKYVLHHHERWDGNGYPTGLSKNEIPLVSQILCVADAWDAMRSKRTYRDSLSYQKAIKEIKINKGTQFSPKVAEALLNFLKK
ncbi:MAG: MEDS domain-containing protein [Bacillota bacterium]